MPKILLSQLAPSGSLEHKIATQIDAADARSMKRRTVIFSALSVLCIALAALSAFLLSSDLRSSGFISYFSLIFSDSSVLVSHLKEFSLSLLEALPVFSLALFLLLCAALAWAVSRLLFIVHRARGKKMRFIAN